MLESGTTAYRAHRAMTLLAGKCGCAAPAFAISHDSIAGALKFGAGRGSLIQGVGAGSVNAERLTMLDKFAAEAPARLTASTVAARLQDVNGQAPRYRPILVICWARLWSFRASQQRRACRGRPSVGRRRSGTSLASSLGEAAGQPL